MPKTLPRYAAAADPRRLVWLFCKQECLGMRWAEMHQLPPPAHLLRIAQAYDYDATCLRCEHVAHDPYNWILPSTPPEPHKERKLNTEKRTEANRRNAQKSTGPRTAAGKARSARNPTRHGLLVDRALLAGESEKELKALRSGMRSSLRPIGELEEELVERMVASVWRKRRGERVELGLWDWRGTVSSGQSTLANVFFMDSQHDQSLQKLTRYMTAASGEFRRAFQMLKEAQEARKAQGEDEWVDEEANEVEVGEEDDDEGDDQGGSANVTGAPPPGRTTEAQATEFSMGPDWVTRAESAATKRDVAPRDPLGLARPTAPPQRWEQMTDAERALFSARNNDRVMAFDDMLQEALGNRQWMERLGVRDLLRVHESFNATMWQTMRSIDELLKDDEPPTEGSDGH